MSWLRRTAFAFLFLMILGWAPVASARAAPADGASVQLSQRPMQINADGAVTVTGWLRCSPPVYTFEYSVGVIQQTGSGNSVLSQREILPCDGKRQRFAIVVAAPTDGVFIDGRADVGIYVGLYDPMAGGDLALEDSVSTRLRTR